MLREFFDRLGKGPGFWVVGQTAVLGVLVLSYFGKDVAALTGPLGVVMGAFFGGGVGKIWSEARHGNGKDSVPS